VIGVIIILLAVNLLLVLWLGFLTYKLNNIRAGFDKVAKASAKGKLPELINTTSRKVESLSKRIDNLVLTHKKTSDNLKGAIQRVGLVRFDAFKDIGGALSFALALLNDQKDGVVISTINGRSESRIFIKDISGGSSESTLSEEEELAIKEAFKEGGRRVKDLSSVKKSML